MTTPGAALSECLAGLPGTARVGVAVSGGGDSVAALVLAVGALGAARVAAATVDHGLRPEAAAEAAGVAALCAQLAVGHKVLRWQDAPEGNLMDAARRARLGLLAAWAREAGLAAVILGHTREDQAETVLIRLARGSGVDGLAGMAPARRALGMLWLRPFLGVGRAALRADLSARGVTWVEDPTNADPRYARTRARAALAALAPLGVTAEGLAATAARLAGAREVLEAAEAGARARLARDDRGTVVLAAAALDLAPETRDRLVGGLIRGLASAPYPPRRADLSRALAALGREGGAATLAGVCLRRQGDAIRLWREPAAVAGLNVDAHELWDGRWRATGPTPGNARIAPLGQDGLTTLSQQAAAGLHPHWRGTGLGAKVLAGLPALWRGADLVAAPLHLWPQDWALAARPLATPADDPGEFD